MNNGMSSKGSDEFTVPLAPEIHDQFDGRVKLPNGEIGKRAFEAYYWVNTTERAIQLHLDWMEMQHGNGTRTITGSAKRVANSPR